MKFEGRRWNEDDRLVISIDCGTTYSAVSYAYLTTNGTPEVLPVTHWFKQPHESRVKVPTLVWYDSTKKAKSSGAAAYTQDEADAEGKGWKLVRHFKLSRHPVTLEAEDPVVDNSLPFDITIAKVYADFFRYLFSHARSHITSKLTEATWQELARKKKIEFVIPHPNGWTPYEQEFLRQAAIDGDLIGSDDAATNVHLISESEAGVHFVAFHTRVQNLLVPMVDFVICDAGGSTVDTTLYNVAKASPNLELREKRGSACVQAGGLYVNRAAKDFIRGEFVSAELPAGRMTPLSKIIKKDFEIGKRMFDDPADPEYFLELMVGPPTISHSTINVKKGILRMNGQRVESFFAGPKEQISRSIHGQMEGHQSTIKYLFLVGGFANSGYLRREIEKEFSKRVKVVLVKEDTGKAVADGGAAWFILRAVKARATRFAFGVTIKVPYASGDWRHRSRQVHSDIDGDFVYGVWSEITPEDKPFEISQVERLTYHRTYTVPNPDLGRFVLQLIAKERGITSYFSADDQGNTVDGFRKIVDISADLSNISHLGAHTGPKGRYWTATFDVGTFFGGNEMLAALFWKNASGVECSSKSKVIAKPFV